MDRSKLEALLDDHFPKLCTFLGLDDWKVYRQFKRLEGKTIAECCLTLDYKQAVISIDMDHLDDDEEILDIVFHELAHVVLWPFDLYRELVVQLVPDVIDGQANGNIESRAWKHACEGGVLMLENLWRGHLKSVYLDKFTRPEPTS